MRSYKDVYNKVVEKLYCRVLEYYGDRLVSFVLFGSVARGRFTPESDIDVLIVVNNLPRGRTSRIMDFMENVEEQVERELENIGIEHMPEISPVIKTPDEVKAGSPLFLDMVDDAVIIYDRDEFFQKYLEELEKKLHRLGSKKVRKGGGWYWVIKPDYKFGEKIEL